MVQARTQKAIGTKDWVLIFIAWALCYFSCQTPLHSASLPAQNANPYWNHFLNDAVSEADLDVRDARNRKIHSRDSRAEFKTLFVFSILRIMVNEDLPVLTRIRKALQELLNPLAETVRTAARRIWDMGESAYFSGARLVVKLSRTSVLALLSAHPPSRSSAGFDSPHPSLLQLSNSILPLRC